MRKLGCQPLVDPTADVRSCALGRYVEVGARARLLDVEMGDYSYVVNDSDIAYTRIGKFCSIASHVRINPGDHPMQRASQSHFTYRASAYFEGACDEGSFFDWRRERAVEIGHDVWIGHGAIVLAGRRIGTGAVVGAGAVVTKDVADYTIVVGNPARVLRRRLPEALAGEMLALGWWNWDHERLHAALDDFRKLDAQEFVDRYSGQMSG